MTERDLNEALARASVHHRVDCVEGMARTWSVVCRVCVETDPDHPNFGNAKTWRASCEENAARIALDHLSRLGYVPRRLPKVVFTPGRLMGDVVLPRNQYE